jgi:hypothetical protein
MFPKDTFTGIQTKQLLLQVSPEGVKYIIHLLP